jgi:hypothetical protein
MRENRMKGIIKLCPQYLEIRENNQAKLDDILTTIDFIYKLFQS